MRRNRSTFHLVAAGAAALLLAAAVPAHALFIPGTRLVELMREYEKSESGSADVLWGNMGRYEGYVLGVCDALDTSIRFPDGITPAQMIAAVAKYLNANAAEVEPSRLRPRAAGDRGVVPPALSGEGAGRLRAAVRGRSSGAPSRRTAPRSSGGP